jgi:hypothetical protein
MDTKTRSQNDPSWQKKRAVGIAEVGDSRRFVDILLYARRSTVSTKCNNFGVREFHNMRGVWDKPNRKCLANASTGDGSSNRGELLERGSSGHSAVGPEKVFADLASVG